VCVCVSPTHTYRNSVMSWFVHLHADVSVLLCLTVSLYVCLSVCVCVSPTHTYRNSVMSWFVHLHADVSVLLCLTVSLYVCLSVCLCVSYTYLQKLCHELVFTHSR